MSNKLNIFELGQEHYDIMSLLEEMEGEITPELQERYDNLLVAGEDKVKSLYKVYKHMAGELLVIESEEKRIDALKKSQKNKLERIKTTMNEFMKVLDLENIKDGTTNIIMAKYTDFDYDESRAPKGYFETVETTKFKLAEFKAWCKDNQEAAAELCGAKFIEGKRIQIK
jgi:Siphovirus Gp157